MTRQVKESYQAWMNILRGKNVKVLTRSHKICSSWQSATIKVLTVMLLTSIKGYLLIMHILFLSQSISPSRSAKPYQIKLPSFKSAASLYPNLFTTYLTVSTSAQQWCVLTTTFLRGFLSDDTITDMIWFSKSDFCCCDVKTLPFADF